MRVIDKIIVHCSATKEGKHFTVADIDRWHRQRGFNGVGYHYVVLLDGKVEIGRKEQVVGAHCKGYNTTSIGVCYIGGLDAVGNPKDTRTKEQKDALNILIKELKKKYPNAKVYPHYKFAAKACPCFDAEKEYANV